MQCRGTSERARPLHIGATAGRTPSASLAVHTAAVLAMLSLVFGIDLVAKLLRP